MTSSTDDSGDELSFEAIPENENTEIDEIAALTVALQGIRAATEPGQDGQVLRGVHPKSHGCVQAVFTVNEDINDNYKVGLFAHPGKTYQAWIRFSNASVLREHDLKDGKNGSRGMAIKIMDVDGETLSKESGQNNQDFLMINTPEFAFGNVRDYLRVERILARDPLGSDPKPYFFPAALAKLGPPKDGEPVELTGKRQFLQDAIAKDPLLKRLSEEDLKGTFASAKISDKISKQVVRNPLQVQYFGAAPFLFGADRVMKFSAVPGEKTVQAPFTDITEDNPSENYLRTALNQTMKGEKDLFFDFRIVVRNIGEENLHIEDATNVWEEEASGYESVARITIPVPQSPNDQCAVEHCEQLVFNPWHSLADHRPLGGINRLRRKVYCDSAKHRSTK